MKTSNKTSKQRRQAPTSPHEPHDLPAVDHKQPPAITWWHIVISLALVAHISAILGEPMRLFSQNTAGMSAPETTYFRQLLSPYIDFVYLHHGYFFFAPNPGPSHLIQARLSGGDIPDKAAMSNIAEKALPEPNSDNDQWLMIPDRAVHKPRLFYHRHFMLAEFLNNSFVPPDAGPMAGQIAGQRTDPSLVKQYEVRRQNYLAIRDSIVSHLQSKHDVAAVEIRRVSHELPNAVQVFEERWPLNDPRLYIIMPETVPPELNSEARK